MQKQCQLFSIDSVESMTIEAVNWLRENLKDQHSLVCFSGGKDSIVTEALVKMSGISYSLNSTLTGIDPPQVTRFIRKNYPDCTFVMPREKCRFWHKITTNNPPGGVGRSAFQWCCASIKEEPSYIIPIKNRIMGIRAEESGRRSKRKRISEYKKFKHHYPIFHWKEWQIWEFIEKHGLAYPKLYDEGFDRIGCVVCPNHHNRHEPYRERWPNHFKCFEKYVHIWWDKRVGQGKNMWFDSPEEFLENWYAGKFYYYKEKP
jgi:phosphoadenosine phosphosulfate reductase